MEREINEMNRDPLHELLCKVVFDEATAEERALIEDELARSEALRAQKAELEATVALVQSARAKEMPAALPAEHFNAVVAAGEAEAGELLAAGPVVGGSPWFASPNLRAAAAFLAMAGAGAVWWSQRAMEPTTESMAGAQPESLSSGSGDTTTARFEREPKRELRRIGYTSADSAEPSQGLFFDESVANLEEVEITPEEQQERALDELYRRSLPEQQGAFIGYSVVTEPTDPNFGYVASGGGEPGTTVLGLDGFAPTDPGTPTIGLDRVSKVVSEASKEAAAGQADEAYMGPGDTAPLGESRVSMPAATESIRARERPASPGPSSSVSASTGLASTGPASTGPASPGPVAGGASGGPASPGPAAPSTPAPAGKALPPISADALSGLGYGGGGGGGEALKLDDNRVQATADDFFLGRGVRRVDEIGPYDRLPRCEPKRLPNERPRDMFFRFWGDNPYIVTKQDAQSTFAADVDTASFTLARRMLREGHLPPREQVRTEEFVNFARPDLAPPAEGVFAVHGELAPSPFGGREDRWLLRVGLRAAEIDRDARPPLALTFVVDTSGSMKEGQRLELVKHALRLLVGELDGRDSIAIVRFSNEASEVLPPTSAASRDAIETALFQLLPDGSTNAEAGLELGYSLAEETLLDGVQTRVVFLSDGVANVGQTDQSRIAAGVAQRAERGIFLNTIGVGMANHNDVFLEQLANDGQGVCDYIGDAEDARRAIVERFVGSFVTVAKDVKIQVEFDGSQVLRWRQLGYENRAVADRDFRNDTVDAGEIGAGHQVTCLYELERPTGADAADAPLATVRVRWKPVKTGEQPVALEAVEIDRTLGAAKIAAGSFRAATTGFRRAALAAQLAEALRRSVHARGDSMAALGKELAQLLAEDRSDDTAAVAEMTKRAIDMGLERYLPAPAATDPDAGHREAYYDALIRSLGGADVAPRAGDVEDRDLEAYERRIRDLLEGDRPSRGH